MSFVRLCVCVCVRACACLSVFESPQKKCVPFTSPPCLTPARPIAPVPSASPVCPARPVLAPETRCRCIPAESHSHTLTTTHIRFSKNLLQLLCAFVYITHHFVVLVREGICNARRSAARAHVRVCARVRSYVNVCVCVVPGGDRSSIGSSGSVTSVRSSGSGQSAGSAAHVLHAQAEGVKVSRTHSRRTNALRARTQGG